MKYTILFFLALMPVSSFAQQAASEYANPVCNMSLPDPTVIRGDDGMFYLYATENRNGLPVLRSGDLIEWEFIGSAFTPEGRPSLVKGANIWAPDISKIGDKYVMHYSMSVWGGQEEASVGAAWADNPLGPFTDAGLLVNMANTGVKNSIDPFYVEQDGKHYIFWGSFNGLYGIEVEPDGLAVKPGAEAIRIAGSAYEATYIHKRDGWYYLFASIGSCCKGVNSTYTMVVGRSKDLFGPYVNKKGDRMLDNRHEVVIKRNERFAGPGHNSAFIKDDNGDDWVLYHAVDVENPRGRHLMLDRVDWVDGWPVVGNGTPSISSVAPVFNKQ